MSSKREKISVTRVQAKSERNWKKSKKGLPTTERVIAKKKPTNLKGNNG